MVPGGNADDGESPAASVPVPPNTDDDSRIAAFARLAPRGVRELWVRRGYDFEQQIRVALGGLDYNTMDSKAKELETKLIYPNFSGSYGKERGALFCSLVCVGH